MTNWSVECPTEADTKQVGAWIAGLARAGDCITLSGDLGCGKTTFARSFIQRLCPEVTAVASPTYTLIQLYDAPKFTIAHCDLYRLKRREELAELALGEYLEDGLGLIEWPEIADPELPQDRLKLTFEILPNGARMLKAEAPSHWLTRLHAHDASQRHSS